jgi:hypothetical protein
MILDHIGLSVRAFHPEGHNIEAVCHQAQAE